MKILKQLDSEDIVYIDIETAKIVPKLEKGTPLYDSWEYKMRYSREAEKFDGTLEEIFDNKAALYAEFAKVICITIGKVQGEKIILKSYASENESELLNDFCDALNGLHAKTKSLRLCGHAITGFDIPFLMRRCLVNGIDLPGLLDTAHLKPWELTFVIDTNTLWRGTGFYSASLINIAVALGLPSPKSDINGSETSEYFYKGELDRIVKYCERDVVTVANIVRKIRGESLVEPSNSTIKIEKVPLMKRLYNTGAATKSDEKELKTVMSVLNEVEHQIAHEIMGVILPSKKGGLK